jgi:hypothetical protein
VASKSTKSIGNPLDAVPPLVYASATGLGVVVLVIGLYNRGGKFTKICDNVVASFMTFTDRLDDFTGSTLASWQSMSKKRR